MKDNKDQVCERADELISLLYGELSEQDARAFNRHLENCASCETDFAGFSQIRESIVSWRNESLGAAWSYGSANQRIEASGPTRHRADAKPSAFAAIREFFNLSPLWLKGAAAFASVLFCVSGIVAVAHLIERPRVTVQTSSAESSEQLTARIAELQNELGKLNAAQKQDQPTQKDPTLVSTPRKSVRPNEFVANEGATKVRNSRKPLTRQERQELAADLGLLASRDEDELDFVTDTINQAP